MFDCQKSWNNVSNEGGSEFYCLNDGFWSLTTQIFNFTILEDIYICFKVLDFNNMPSLRMRKEASNEPAVDPSLADSKPAEATEAEGPWVKNAHDS